MRTFEEIAVDVEQACATNDAEALSRYAAELEPIGTPQAEAMASNSRGGSAYLRGDYSAALEFFQRALALYEELGSRRGVASLMGNIGNVYNVTGDYPQALTHYHRALELYEELGDRRGVALITGNTGLVHHSTGDYPEALIHSHRALALYEELGDRGGAAGVMCNIGMAHGCTGDYPAALEHYHRALALCEEVGNRSFAANITGNIGAVHHSTGDYPAAMSHYHRALALHEELGNRSGVARAMVHIVSVYVDMGSDDEAKRLLATMDGMHIDEPGPRIDRELQRATLLERSGDLDGAAATLHHALSEALEHGLRSKAADVHKSLRDLALKQNNLAEYVEHNNEYTRITEEINGKETATKLAMQAKQREIDAVQREHQKHMAVLHSTLPKHIADRVARGETVNDQHESAVVIFLDIVGFTSISDRIPSGHVVHLLEQVFTTLDTVCKKHDVIKIKTIGDSYMAVAFSNTENQIPNTMHVVSAGLCAVEMLSALNALEITMPPELGDTSWTKDIGDIQVRIGMHCGPVTAGVIGTERMQYDVWGDTVNTASRMESHGEPGRIHVSEVFATALRSENGDLRTENDPSPHPPVPLSLHQRGTIDIKGKGPMTTFWLEGAT